MPMMDLSVALTDPFTLDTFAVWRRRQVVNGFGEAKVDLTKIEGVRGVVYTQGANGLTRKPEVQVNTKTIVVLTRYALRGESQDANDGGKYQPDVIRWNGNSYVVVNVEDYSNYAQGFVMVTATSIDIVDQSPSPKGQGTDAENALEGSGFGNDSFGGGTVEGQ